MWPKNDWPWWITETWNYNPGQNSWGIKAITRKMTYISPPPMQCWCQAFKSFLVDSTLIGRRGDKRNGLLKHCQPSFKRWIQSLFNEVYFLSLIFITVPWRFHQGCRQRLHDEPCNGGFGHTFLLPQKILISWGSEMPFSVIFQETVSLTKTWQFTCYNLCCLDV